MPKEVAAQTISAIARSRYIEQNKEVYSSAPSSVFVRFVIGIRIYI